MPDCADLWREDVLSFFFVLFFVLFLSFFLFFFFFFSLLLSPFLLPLHGSSRLCLPAHSAGLRWRDCTASLCALVCVPEKVHLDARPQTVDNCRPRLSTTSCRGEQTCVIVYTLLAPFPERRIRPSSPYHAGPIWKWKNDHHRPSPPQKGGDERRARAHPVP